MLPLEWSWALRLHALQGGDLSAVADAVATTTRSLVGPAAASQTRRWRKTLEM